MRHLVICILLVAAPSVAAADDAAPEPSTFARPHVGLEVLAGLGTPVGALGASLIATPHRRLSFELGVGVALRGDVQHAIMVRGRTGRTLSLGLGLSRGGYTFDYFTGIISQGHKHWDDARWINGEVSFERSFPKVQLRMFAGVGQQLFPDEGCVEEFTDDSGLPSDSRPPRPCSGAGGTHLVYAGAALRFATPLGG